MKLEELKKQYPEVYQLIYDDGLKAGIDTGQADGLKLGQQTGLEEGRAQGVLAERARIKGIFECSMPGHEALVLSLMFDGSTSPEQAAVKVLTAEKALQLSKVEALAQGAIAPVPLSAIPPAPTKPDFETLVATYMQEKSCSEGIAIQAVAKAHPAEHNAFIDKVNAPPKKKGGE